MCIRDSLSTATGVMVRSAAMHDMELPDSLLAIARAGAGVNNIPVDNCSDCLLYTSSATVGDTLRTASRPSGVNPVTLVQLSSSTPCLCRV